MDKKYIIALEIAGSKVTGVLASLTTYHNSPNQHPTIDSIVSIDDNESVHYGRVQNLITANKSASQVIRELSKHPSISDGGITGCYVSLYGRSFGSEAVTEQIELATEMEITRETVKKLIDKAAKRAVASKKVLKVIPRKFYVNERLTTDPIGALGRSLRGEFTLVTCDPANERNIARVLTEKMDLTINDFVPAPLAEADLVLSDEEKQQGCALVNIGASTVTISIYKDRVLQYIATLPLGSKFITNDISREMNMPFDRAEEAKCKYGDAMPMSTAGGDDVSRMNGLVTARAYEIVANIVAYIGFAGFKPQQLPAGFVITGRAAKLPNLDNLLEKHSKMNVRIAQVPSTVNFGFNTSETDISDDLSAIAIVEAVSKRAHLLECVHTDSNAASHETQVAESDTIVLENTQPKPSQHEQQMLINSRYDTGDSDDDDNWKKDDQDPRESTAKTIDSRGRNDKKEKELKDDTIFTEQQTKKPSLIERLKKSVNSLLSTEEIDDAEL